MVKVRTALLVVLLLLVGGFGLWAGYQWGREPPPPPEIRTEIVERMVPVEVVKEIEVEVPGPERVIERVRFVTEGGEADPEVVQVIRDTPPETPVIGRVRIDADKYEGTVDGTLTRGWVGTAACDVRSGDSPWRTLVLEPFDLSASDAVSTVLPGTIEERLARWRVETRVGLTTAPGLSAGVSWFRTSRVGWWIQADYDLDPAIEFVPQLESYRSLDRWEISGGIAFTWGRR